MRLYVEVTTIRKFKSTPTSCVGQCGHKKCRESCDQKLASLKCQIHQGPAALPTELRTSLFW